MGYFTLIKANGETPGKAILAENIITNNGKDALINSVKDNVGPGWLYLAAGLGTTAPGSADENLYQEIHREPIVGKYSPQQGTLTMVGVFGPYVGVGNWKEVGVFDSDVQRVTVSSCEGTADWASDGTLTTNSVIVQEGQASLRTQMTAAGTIAFAYGPVSANPGEGSTWGSTDYFQFWFRRSVNTGALTIRLGPNASNYYQWSWSPGASVDTWWQFFQQFSSASIVGMPGTGDFRYFRITHPAYGSPGYYEYIDYLTVYQDAGTLLARGTVDVSKEYNTVMNLFHTHVYQTQ